MYIFFLAGNISALKYCKNWAIGVYDNTGKYKINY